jgi:hypothetical protein
MLEGEEQLRINTRQASQILGIYLICFALVGLVGSLLNRYIYIERMSFPNGIKQRLQLWRWGRLRPRPPIAPQHYPRVQPSPYSP